MNKYTEDEYNGIEIDISKKMTALYFVKSILMVILNALFVLFLLINRESMNDNGWLVPLSAFLILSTICLCFYVKDSVVMLHMIIMMESVTKEMVTKLHKMDSEEDEIHRIIRGIDIEKIMQLAKKIEGSNEEDVL